MAKAKANESTEQVILEAARRIFIKQGMAGARMQDIADEAGINKALLHYYFNSKEKLFETIFQESVQRFIPRVNEIFDSGVPLFEQIETFCFEYISLLQANPFIPLFVISEAHRQPDDFLGRMFGKQKPNVPKFASQIEDAVKNGLIKPIHPIQLVMNMMSLCIFPFAAKPVIQKLAGASEKMYSDLIEQRKTEVPKFIIDSIRK